MKKKIILTLAVVIALVTLLAIGVSAARVEDYDAKFTLRDQANIVHYEKWYYNENKNYVRQGYTDTVTVSFIDENGNPLTEVAMWEYDETEDKYYSLVWYISDYKLTWEDKIYTDANVGDQTYPKYTAALYTLSKVRAVDLRYVFNQYNTTHDAWKDADGNKITYSLKSLKGIYLTNGTEDTSDDLRLQHAQGIGRDNDNYGYVGYDAQFAATGNKIVVGNFRDCDFERDEEGNYGTANTWSRADNLQCLWYPDTVKYICAGIGPVYEVDLGDGMEIIACQVLRDNKKVKEFKVPSTCLFINNEAFRGTDLTKLILSESLALHGSAPFLYTGTSDIVVVSKNTINSTTANITNFLGGKDAKQTIYTDGSLIDATKLQEKLIATNATFGNSGRIVLYDYNTTQQRADSDKYTVIFYNYNRCEAFYNAQHDLVSEAGNTCCGICSRCGETEMLENLEHTYEWIFNGGKDVSFVAEITAEHVCKWCKTLENAETIAIIVSTDGYSTEDNGTGVYQLTKVNKAALNRYAELSEQTFDYGIFAGIAAEDEGTPLTLDENGNATAVDTKNTVFASFTGTEYTYLQIKVTGLNKDASIYCGAYLIIGEDIIYLADKKIGTTVSKFVPTIVQ